MSISIMSNSCSATCFVPGCNTGYTSVRQKNKSLGIKNPSIFRAPKDPVLLNKWRHAIPRAYRILSEKDVVCEHHFAESDVKQFYETKLSDGTIFKLEMGRPRLQEGAIPSIFPNLPSYLSKPSRKRKAPPARNVPVNKKNAPLVADNVAATKQNFTIPLLTESLQKISKPNCLWTVNSVVEFIVCARWATNYMCEKRVIIDKDMTIKVSFVLTFL
ncbi:uncharacterized protein LOC118189672 [Stegodyphus dumicola]|uniref:uncharacterized protein LOC118189672 n=1 Tax=Stegodyphus dumicola TaxID=202533 RepID=UPI0015AB310F|nr:uncharacterized protein LOC118189672 [Stegodyphus dumicola]